MDKKEELTQIVELVQKDMDQFEILYSHIANKVYYWCFNAVRDETTAKDLAQESMIKVYQKLHTLENVDTFNSWLYALVRNICYSYLRTLKNADSLFLEDEDYTENFEDTIAEERIDNLPDESYNLKETKQLIVSFIENLPAKQKEVIMLFYLEEFTTNEIAELVDSNVSSVRSRLLYGRKNLEKQINEYQVKNNTKLYSTILLPLLGMLLQEHREQLCNNQDLAYDESLYSSKATTVQGTTSLNMFSILGASLAVVAMVAFLALTVFPDMGDKEQGIIANYGSSIMDVDLFSKGKSNPYIESIDYDTYRTRSSTEVLINLKKDTDDKKIKILFNDEEITFDKTDKVITIIAKSNGEYTLVIDEKEIPFTVNRLDEYAPELVEVQNYGSYIQLIMNDEKSRMDYEKSYMQFEGKNYQIGKNNQIEGNFKGNLKIYIYNDLNQYICHEFNLK